MGTLANTILCANTKLLVDDEMMNVYVHELREKRDRHLVKTMQAYIHRLMMLFSIFSQIMEKENTIISLRSAVLGPNLNYSKLIVSLQFLLFTVNDFVICSIKRNVILQMLIFIKYSLLVDRIMTQKHIYIIFISIILLSNLYKF